MDFLQLVGGRQESLAELAGNAAGKSVGGVLDALFSGKINAAKALQEIVGELCEK